MKKSIFNIMWSIGGLGARAIIQIAYFVLLARVLGPSDYGAISATFSIINIFVPFSAWGSGEFLVKNVSRDKGKFSKYWGTAILSIIIFGSIFLLFSLFLYFIILSSKISIVPVILLCFSELFFVQIVNISIQAYQAFEILSKTALIQFVFSLIRLLITLLFVLFIRDHSITTWAIVYLFGTTMASVFCLILVRVELGKACFIFSSITESLKERFYFSLSSSSLSVYNDFDKSILSKYATLDITGNYAAAYRIIDAFCIPIKALLQTFYPKFFIQGKDGICSSKSFAQKLFPIFFSYSIFAVLLILIFSRYLPVLFGNSYKESVNIIWLLSPIIIFRAIHSLGADTLTGAGMQGKRSGAQLFVAVFNGVLCLTLIPLKGWIGAAWASLLSDGILVILIWGIIFSASRSSSSLAKKEQIVG
jgi:O-antigen/teichoic acid export membrane protein